MYRSPRTMSNTYGISKQDEQEIRARDKTCVYCGILMKQYPHAMGASGATIEHFNNDGPSLEKLIDANSFRQIRQLCRFTTFNCEMRRALFILSEETACSKIGPNRIRLKVPCRSHYQVGTIRQVNSKRPGGGGRT